jgi:hypothetical protein
MGGRPRLSPFLPTGRQGAREGRWVSIEINTANQMPLYDSDAPCQCSVARASGWALASVLHTDLGASRLYGRRQYFVDRRMDRPLNEVGFVRMQCGEW